MLKLLPMRNIIRKGLILLLLSLLPRIPVLCQITLDAGQTKTLSLILIEHEKLNEENPLLKQQIHSLERLNQLYIDSDSIQFEEIKNLKLQVVSNEKKIQQMKSTQKKTIFGASVGGIVLFFIGLLL